jgi:hypothetical protein
LQPNAKFQNPAINPSGRIISEAERKKKKKRKKEKKAVNIGHF